MVAQRKFAQGTTGAKHSDNEASNPPAQVSVDDARRQKGRKAGKRSDPAFRPTTIFVRKETQRKATRLLEDQDTGKDFSDLIEELLANWIIDHSPRLRKN